VRAQRRASQAERRAICLLSPHPLVLGEFERLLSKAGFHLECHRLGSTLSPDLRRLSPASVFVVDAHLPRPATEAVLVGILERFPAARLLVAAETLDEASSFPLLRLGVKGLIRYAETRELLPRALDAVARGGFWAPRALLSRFMDSMLIRIRSRNQWGSADISGREREVLEALLASLSNKEIAGKLEISERTVKFHVSNLLAKFGVERRQHLLLHCLQVRPTGS
jgi:DNA-binding NarL/FixJ family response regulator